MLWELISIYAHRVHLVNIPTIETEIYVVCV